MLAARNSVGYETVKTGIIGMTREMAVDFGPIGVRVNAICPGLIVKDPEAWQTPDRKPMSDLLAAQYPGMHDCDTLQKLWSKLTK